VAEHVEPGDQTRDEAAPSTRAADAQRVRIELPSFEGPLDLLLHLIQEHKVDILHIPISFIAEKYLAFLDLMRVLNLDIAGEYLLMAATLAHMKSKELLPKTDEALLEDEEEPDPRGALIRRLLEYQKYKQAAESLSQRPLLARDVFARPAVNDGEPREDAPLAEVSVFHLLEAFAQVLKRVGGTAAHEVDVDRLSVSERIAELAERLRGIDRVKFDELFDGTMERHMIIVTFLALLEMTRLRLVRLFQEAARESIFIAATGVTANGDTDLDAAFEYRERELEPSPLPAPRALSPEEEEALRLLETAEEREARREEEAYAAFDEDEGDDGDESNDLDDEPPKGR
jgi:segregation and condensation protein A